MEAMWTRFLPLVRLPPPGQNRAHDEIFGRGPKAWAKRLRRAQFGQQDKCLGLAELVDAIATGRPQFPESDFTLHVTELTLAIQAAGPEGAGHALETRFNPLPLPDRTRAAAPDYRPFTRPGPVPRALSHLLGRLGGRRH